ncbi:MAG TPA: CRISPR-associated protein Cas4 [Chitinophagales bacterium]|nr:CRISPR-associated protein Cas4 [Chitinophagales bacterium]
MFSLTPSHIIEHLFCPRYTYFEYVLAIPEYQEKYYKVEKGRNVHQDKATINKDYLRKKIDVIEKWQNQYLTNNLLRGEIDEVLLLSNNTMAPLDYKFAIFPGTVYDTYKNQLFCYALLIEDNFGKPVEKGFLVYTRSKNQLIEIPITQTDKDRVRTIAHEIMHIIEANFYPNATPFKKRCIDCTYKNICTR